MWPGTHSCQGLRCPKNGSNRRPGRSTPARPPAGVRPPLAPPAWRGPQRWLGEYVGILLDTFYDRRNAVELVVNPLGGRMDGQITDERAWNGDWNPVWNVRTGRFAGGWTFEAEIPFRSLRYRPGRAQTWGFNVERRVAWKNEYSTLVPLPASWGFGAIMQVSQAATLVGLEAPSGGLNLEVKPYATGELNGVRTTDPAIAYDAAPDAGLDVKYGVTQNLVADLTVNTDFAQVEADEQQINLTRFSLYFPEKREFFLENQGIFAFGGEAGAGQFAGISNTPILFYSRQIGLNQGFEVPMDAGGRLTGRIGPFSVGMLNIQTAETPAGAEATNFSVVRLRRNLLRRSSVGALFTGRSVSQHGDGSNEAYGVDGLFSFYENLNLSTYWAETRTPGRGDDDISYRAQLDYSGDRYGVQMERLAVGADFNPEMGFCGARRSNAASGCSASARARGHSPRSASSSSKDTSTTSRIATACWRPGRPWAASRSTSRTATSSTSPTRTTTSSWNTRFQSPPTSPSRWTAIASRTSRWATRWGSRGACRAGCRCSTAASTAVPGPA